MEKKSVCACIHAGFCIITLEYHAMRNPLCQVKSAFSADFL
jgi:hypothetical protein